MSHARTGSGFQYDTTRYATLTEVIEQCTSDRYEQLLPEKLLDRVAMNDTVPGREVLLTPGAFSSRAMERYAAVVQRTALPYRLDARGRPVRSEYAGDPLSASTGLISTVRDLARFDAALDAGVLLAPDTRSRAWQATTGPAGLGWFVQQYNGQRLIWHFGLVHDAYSALYIKVPDRKLTLVLLANSDGLAAPYNLSSGDVTTSLFAQLFLKLFVP
jgi:CubicO group peptidase (beta-lactamase class C family)